MITYVHNTTVLHIMFKFIPTASTGVRQTFGKFSGTCNPGLNFYVPFIQNISVVSNMIQNKEFYLRVKTKDNVFTDLNIGVQIQIKTENTEKAFFSLENPEHQIDTYVQNVVRSKVPTMKLDELFESQGAIGESVKHNLHDKMSEYGYTIVDTLINDISPDPQVMKAMNAINASERLKAAAVNKADAEYITRVREAEADRDRKILQGEGISGQRLAILKGYEEGIGEMSGTLGLSSKDIVNFVLQTQRFDMLENIGTSQNAKTVFLNHQLDGMGAEIRDATMQASEID
jgi:regulator of protease activity HflC (stomatin/prohibitin superfamily)